MLLCTSASAGFSNQDCRSACLFFFQQRAVSLSAAAISSHSSREGEEEKQPKCWITNEDTDSPQRYLSLLCGAAWDVPQQPEHRCSQRQSVSAARGAKGPEHPLIIKGKLSVIRSCASCFLLSRFLMSMFIKVTRK